MNKLVVDLDDSRIEIIRIIGSILVLVIACG